MLQFVQVTAAYSNAVLVAILPYVSDFSRKIQAPIPTPVTTNMIRLFKCDNRKDHVGGFLVLTNGYEFAFLEGRVSLYRSPWSYFSLQHPDLVPKFYGTVRINEAEALKIARQTITNLGYTRSVFFADRPPRVTPPDTIFGHTIPRYRFEWLDPNWHRSDNSPGSVLPVVLQIEVDASNRRVQMLAIVSTNAVRSEPKVSVVPPLDNSLPPAHRSTRDGEISTQPVSAAYSQAFLPAILP